MIDLRKYIVNHIISRRIINSGHTVYEHKLRIGSEYVSIQLSYDNTNHIFRADLYDPRIIVHSRFDHQLNITWLIHGMTITSTFYMDGDYLSYDVTTSSSGTIDGNLPNFMQFTKN